jgi:hypothetical protein
MSWTDAAGRFTGGKSECCGAVRTPAVCRLKPWLSRTKRTLKDIPRRCLALRGLCGSRRGMQCENRNSRHAAPQPPKGVAATP